MRLPIVLTHPFAVSGAMALATLAASVRRDGGVRVRELVASFAVRDRGPRRHSFSFSAVALFISTLPQAKTWPTVKVSTWIDIGVGLGSLVAALAVRAASFLQHVKAVVVGPRHQFQVLHGIITGIVVAVMDDFGRIQKAAHHLLHNKAVFQDIAVAVRMGMLRAVDVPVAFGVQETPTLPGRVEFALLALGAGPAGSCGDDDGADLLIGGFETTSDLAIRKPVLDVEAKNFRGVHTV
jgi:hypothetical protein